MQLKSFTRVLLCTSALIATSVSASAEEATKLDLITVTVLKIKQLLSDVAGGVSVGTKKEKDLYGQQTVQQVLAPMPGVSASQNATDPATAINIRGLQDFGRVAVTIDGARQNFQRSGHNANGMFYFEPEQMQQVTVTRGPIANVYGSGAIGGVVSFETLDPLLFLNPDEQIAGSQKLSYASNGGNLLSSTTGAMRFGEYGAVLGNFVYRDNGNYSDGSGNEVVSSARDIKSGLGKLALTPSDEVRVDLSYLINSDNFHTPAISPSTTQYDNDVTAETASAKLNWKPKDNQLIDFTASGYWTGTDQSQIVTNASNPANIGKRRNFQIDTLGTDVFNTSHFALGSSNHALTIGADVFQDQVNVVDPISTAALFTPSGTRTAGGAFVQDKIDLTRWIEFVVAGRYDAYSLDGGATSSSGSHFSPKGTVVLKPFENSSLKGLYFYGTYAEGYRAPAITETLINGTHPFPAFNFEPNPNLRPETSHTLEAGLTGKFDSALRSDDRVTVRASVYQNNVDDYIDALYIDGGNDDFCGPPFACYNNDTYQYVNITKAKLHGIEAEVAYDSNLFFGGIAGSMIRGDSETSGNPLLNVPADKIVTTVGFHFADQKGSIGARWFAVAAQDRVPPSTLATTSPLPSNAYNLVNLFASYAVNDNLNLGLNVDNIFNETYKPYLDSANSPGRSVMLTVTTRFGK